MDCPYPVYIKTADCLKETGYPYTHMAVPCGKCYVCKSNKRREWFTRLYFEQKRVPSSVFVTLTYDDEHLPVKSGRPCVVKRDIQLFLKRLRKKCSFRYFIVSEYGPTTLRPHYHGLFFGLSVMDEPKILSAWQNGFVSVGSVTSNSINYVCKYCLPFINDDFYNGFMLCSKRPAIGLSLLTEDFKKYVLSDTENRLAIKTDGRQFILPRYYRNKLDIKVNGEELYKYRKQKNEEFADKYGEYGGKLHKELVKDFERKCFNKIKKSKL